MEAGQNSEYQAMLRTWEPARLIEEINSTRRFARSITKENEALEERIRTLTERLEALVDAGDHKPDSEWWPCCLNPASAPHSIDCPWILAKQALEEQGT